MNGIIAHITRKHCGDVHDKGIAMDYAQSIYTENDMLAMRNLPPRTPFVFVSMSPDDSGQWICFDFKEMRVYPSHYTIVSPYLKSLVVESSLDGAAWREIDRTTDNYDLKGPDKTGFCARESWASASFAVSNSPECRFIRPTQTGPRHRPAWSYLPTFSLEVFGTLLE
jgi:hypothetical protein